jgi:predicted component of type VI protein secretion system
VEIELTIESRESGQVVVKRLPWGSNRVVLGRGPDSPVTLDGVGVSREHISLEASPEGVKVADLSANGTWINGLRLQPGTRYIATEADRVSIPGYDLRFLLIGGAPPPKVQASTTASPAKPPAAGGMAAAPVPAAKAVVKPPLAITRLEWFAASVVVLAIAITVIYVQM